ncbi:MAG TPA: hypothetical protein VFT19_10775 [Solirubrobacterales bacterium]|nr:hypothetical protein [Solirubrobacterales bacterium]
MATSTRKLKISIGDLIEVDGRRYEVVPDKMGGVTLEPPITPMAEIDAEQGTRPASAEDFERLTAGMPSDGEG